MRCACYLVGNAEEILQVMAHFMGDHIALRRIARSAPSLFFMSW